MKAVFSLGVSLLIITGCGPALKENVARDRTAPPPRHRADNGARADASVIKKTDARGGGKVEGPSRTERDSVAALRRDRDRLRRELNRLYGERERRDAELRLTKDFLADLFGALDAEDYSRALASIDRFLRAHPGHSLRPPVSALRPTVEKLQTGAAKREALREEIRRLKDIQFRFDDLRKEGT